MTTGTMTHARTARFGLIVTLGLSGCASLPLATPTIDRMDARDRALKVLRAAIGYQPNPVVRVEAVEAFESSGRTQARPWIRAALLDDHPAVRFAACVAVGQLKDSLAEQSVRRCLDDKNASVQIAAIFALHRLGDTKEVGRLPTYLLRNKDAAVRRNAALLLGLLGEPDAVKVLARAMRDEDAGVRHHALEAMARLGNAEARRELTFMTRAGIGSEEVFAITALAQTGDPAYRETFRYKLATAPHLETRLAAAAALGRLGSDEGFAVALRALHTRRRLVHDANDPPAGQILRARQMAAVALGAIGRVDALPALLRQMDDSADPRVQVSAARAILEILKADRQRGLVPPPTEPGR